ncbi:YdeI/OmpD-associated family protein [Rubinisphaera sp. JC750]|uniref:YdeI/OmpD-associated family protein n=1 Tax=Rubinisphaera sp. JC750 TaxID=2898658 RepID=UPI001F2F1EB2|nr:YdeI/OmpD-associated family protein [Rubinisphaera sp. JC750]
MNRLSREVNPMPDFVRDALEAEKLMQAYNERPPYQRNDYLGWIAKGKRQATQEKRLRQMLDELQQGGIYMKMDHPASRRS